MLGRRWPPRLAISSDSSASERFSISFVTGLLGVNVGGIPAADNSWGFWGVSILLAALVGLEVWLFKKIEILCDLK